MTQSLDYEQNLLRVFQYTRLIGLMARSGFFDQSNTQGMSGMTMGLQGWPTRVGVLIMVLLVASPARAQRLAEEPWWERSFEASSEYYEIKTDLPRSDAQAVARHLDSMYEEYSRRLASLPPP